MNSKYTITRRFQFCAGHRVYGHESKCANPHGHNYVAYVTVAPLFQGGLDSLGRVVDFSVLKTIIGSWLEINWDHGFIYYKEDKELLIFLSASDSKRFEMDCNPTAENMANYLRLIADQLLLDRGLYCTKVVLEETENCSAESYEQRR